MSASTPLHLPSEDKLDVLRFLDEFHYWHSLDDESVCKRCGRTITGRQILIIELQGTRGKLRLQCPSAGCVSTPGDWAYANPVQAAKRRTESRPTRGRAADEAKDKSIADQRTHHGERPVKRKTPPAAFSVRAALARLVLLRPIASALHAFRPAA